LYGCLVADACRIHSGICDPDGPYCCPWAARIRAIMSWSCAVGADGVPIASESSPELIPVACVGRSETPAACDGKELLSGGLYGSPTAREGKSETPAAWRGKLEIPSAFSNDPSDDGPPVPPI